MPARCFTCFESCFFSYIIVRLSLCCGGGGDGSWGRGSEEACEASRRILLRLVLLIYAEVVVSLQGKAHHRVGDTFAA